eukprot:TRINITY_DN16037_c0_g1_i1.p1 TRINITY_DN16037_c0_g1~~TRINITY_DN16037_c0_g1_i1.p1  ORF type:complete len:164 (+),score=23.27 TRINITY_DN16037_c0_g1_i1:144-635(+)
MLQDPTVTKFLYWAPQTTEVFATFFNPVAEEIATARSNGKPPEKIVLVIRETISRKFAGNAGLNSVDFCPGNYEVGYQLEEHAWGKGLATAAAKALTAIGFDELGAHKIEADLHASNVGSARVLEKAGFVKEGLLRGYYKVEGGFEDRGLYGLTVAQYRALAR